MSKPSAPPSPPRERRLTPIGEIVRSGLHIVGPDGTGTCRPSGAAGTISRCMTRTCLSKPTARTRPAPWPPLSAPVQPGDVLCLIGDLGAGKTTLTQGLALGLGLPPDEPVNSPTFTLLAEHPGGRVPLYHFDVYRLPDSSGLYDLAFDEYLSGDGVVVIEWADRIADALPPDRLDIALTVGGPGQAAHCDDGAWGTSGTSSTGYGMHRQTQQIMGRGIQDTLLSKL